MSKAWTIFAREYWIRIKSKGYIIATLLGPITLVALMLAPVLILQFTSDQAAEREIAVVDETGVLFDELAAPAGATLRRATEPVDTLRARVQREELSGYLVLPEALLEGEGQAAYYSLGGGGLSFRFEIERTISRAVRDRRMKEAGASEEVLAAMREDVSLRMNKVTESGEDEADSTGLLVAVGYAMGFIIYLSVFIYGSLVMRGVIEEKTSRIMEVVISSARPFQLMLGKVLGIGAVGLTQLLVWVGLSAVLLAFGGAIIAGFLDPAELNLPDSASQEAMLEAANITIPTVPLSLVVYFVLYFLGGYLLYASLFAAVGSAVDQESDAQQFVLPISMPVILSFFFVGVIVDNPDTTLSVVLSMVPFFSPILMTVRIAVANVPFWQVFLSLLLLALTVLGTIWLSARIYRVGVLMYGKKPSFKDLVRWVRYA